MQLKKQTFFIQQGWTGNSVAADLASLARWRQAPSIHGNTERVPLIAWPDRLILLAEDGADVFRF